MATKLMSETMDEWYKRLNFARTQAGIGLPEIVETGYQKTDTLKRITDLISSISRTHTENTFLAMADNSIDTAHFYKNGKIRMEDKEAIDAATVSLLRVCPNVSCQTVCSNSGTNSNGTNSNGTNSNGSYSNGTNANGTNSYGTNGNGANSNGNGYYSNGACNNGSTPTVTYSNGDYTNGSYSCENGTCPNGAYSNQNCANGSYTNGSDANGVNANGTDTNGCTDKIYQEGTATYSAKDFYSEEEALRRVGP